MEDVALFRRVGRGEYVPTEYAIGPWDPSIVHGAAIAALLAGRMEPDRDEEGTLARLTVEILAPVPLAPLRLTLADGTAGSRVRRGTALLSRAEDDRPVATASAVIVRRRRLDLPEGALNTGTPFSPEAAPTLDKADPGVAEGVGWKGFDSQSIALKWQQHAQDPRTHLWVGLPVPVVEGSERTTVELAAVGADFSQSAVNRVLPYRSWSFRNAEITIHFARRPIGEWIGVRSEVLLGEVGTGFGSSDLFDCLGRVARSAATLVVEPRLPV
jgi:Acyl-CoA thioesterase C-terminal domain/Acyl-CoA thioesterase N-terminal domain